MKNTKRSAFALSILIALLCSGCGAKLEYGEVVAMNIEPESNQLVLIPMTISTGKTTTTIMQQYWIFDDEDFVLTIRGHDEDGEIVTENWYVTKAEYEKTAIGDKKGYSREFASREDEHKKTKVRT